MIGGRFGNAGLGQTIGGTVGGLAQRFLPFEAARPVFAPQGFAPQGFIGDALGAIGAPLGGVIGGRFGNAGLGQTIGGTVGGLAQRFLPFEAAPVFAPQGFAPQGFIGDALGAIGAPLGGVIGGRFGNAGLGQTIGGTVGGLAQRFLPFEAAPVFAPQGFAPQGFIGDALGAIGAPLGGVIGGRFGNAGLGQTIGGTVGGLAQRFLPFEAGPQPVYYVPQQMAPMYG